LPTDLENGQTFYSFDPFPPSDSVACYQRPERPDLRINSSYNRLGMLFRSLIPGFNLQNFLVNPDVNGAGAIAGVEGQNDIGMLNAIQESIRDFIRDIGIVQPQQEREDENNGDSGDEHENPTPEFD